MKTISEFKECPDCKVDARLMNSIVQEEVLKGNMGEDTIAFTDAKIICNIDPRRPPIAGGRVPGARVIRDICTKCGREFTTKIERGYVTPPTTPGGVPIFS
jgi:hypothetical protein